MARLFGILAPTTGELGDGGGGGGAGRWKAQGGWGKVLLRAFSTHLD